MVNALVKFLSWVLVSIDQMSNQYKLQILVFNKNIFKNVVKKYHIKFLGGVAVALARYKI